MEYPEHFVEGTKICVCVNRDRVTLYGNKQAYETLGRWMNYIAQANPDELVHCDLAWHLETYDSLNSENSNVFFLFDKSLHPVFVDELEKKNEMMDLTFHIVRDEVLKKFERFRASKISPETLE